MILAIRHKTIYEYDRPVFLEPHTIRLTPRADSYKALIERVMTIIPEPVGVSVESWDRRVDEPFCVV